MNGVRRAGGFTLIEMMVAMVIFLLFTGAVYGIFTTAQQAILRAEDTEEVYQTGRVLLAQLSTELTSAYQPAAATTSRLVGEDSGDADESLQKDRLSFLTTAHVLPGDQPAGDLCQVTYELGDETTDEKPGLYVEEKRYPDLDIETEEPQRRLLSPLVIGFNCRYLPEGADWVTEWVDQPALPTAVRIELTLQPPREGAKPIVLVTTTNLLMKPAPATEGTGGTGGAGGTGDTGGTGGTGGGGGTGGTGGIGGGTGGPGGTGGMSGPARSRAIGGHHARP